MINSLIKSSHGFTLIELLIAISISSVLAVMAYGGLQTVLSAKQSSQKFAQQLSEIQLVSLRISNDLRQAVNRKIRDEYGDPLPAMFLNRNIANSLEWSRAGYRNPARLSRSNVQRVAYRLDQKKLIRTTWPVLDRAQDTEANEIELLSGVDSVEWRFLNTEREWLPDWPQEDEKALDQPLPRAVELVFELEGWGKIRRLILLANEA